MGDPIAWLYTLGVLMWPVGLFALGGFHHRAGQIVILAGSIIALVTRIVMIMRRRGRPPRRPGRRRTAPPAPRERFRSPSSVRRELRQNARDRRRRGR